MSKTKATKQGQPSSASAPKPARVDLAHNLFVHMRAALSQLLRAHHFARDLKCKPWNLAIEATELRNCGLSNTDLRWLVAKGYVEHLREVSQPGESAREFRRTNNLKFTRRSCFLLTPAGVAFAQQLLKKESESDNHKPQQSADSSESDRGPHVPEWDAERRELSVAGLTVKRFRVPAPNQERILSAFQEEGWPERIDDPLPPSPEIDPKRRVHAAINSLNRNQKHHRVHFSGDGNGNGVCWELITNSRH